jgi:hypothetical protein
MLTMLTRPNRLARSARDLVNTLAAMTAKAPLLSAWRHMANRRRPGRGRARGVKLGRKPKLTEHQTKKAIRRRAHGVDTLGELRAYSGRAISSL